MSASPTDVVTNTFLTPEGGLRLPQMQSVIAGTLTFVVSWLWLQGMDVPEGLLNVYLIVIGFFFGDRLRQTANQREAARLPEPVSG